MTILPKPKRIAAYIEGIIKRKKKGGRKTPNEKAEEGNITCPFCNSIAPLGSDECPKCGRPFDASLFDDIIDDHPGITPSEVSPFMIENKLHKLNESLQTLESEDKILLKLKKLSRDRLVFYAGLILISIGGPGAVLSSYFHDWFGLPIGGTTYDAFGWLNVICAIAGAIVLLAGIVLVILSLRGGIINMEDIDRVIPES